MEYHQGQELIWYRDNNFDQPERVTVSEVRSRGQAMLSNGWVVNADGWAEGNSRVRGGYVLEEKVGFVITDDWLHAHCSERGGYTRDQLTAIGVDWPPVSGWKTRVIGQTITTTERDRFEKKDQACQQLF